MKYIFYGKCFYLHKRKSCSSGVSENMDVFWALWFDLDRQRTHWGGTLTLFEICLLAIGQNKQTKKQKTTKSKNKTKNKSHTRTRLACSSTVKTVLEWGKFVRSITEFQSMVEYLHFYNNCKSVISLFFISHIKPKLTFDSASDVM